MAQQNDSKTTRGALVLWLAATRISLGSSRLVITIPIYVLLGGVALIPLGFLAFLILPFRPSQSIFDSFLGDLLAAPRGAPQAAASYFYFYLYLMSYLSIASVIGYEERRDRSIMFWKSLPIGDGMWIVGQITALFVAFGIGLTSLTIICSVITVWEYFYILGLHYPQPSLLAGFGQTLLTIGDFAQQALLILCLSLPFGVSMLWFATFCRRQPGGVWMGTFVSIYVLLFLLRYIGIDAAEPLLWYPDTFGRITFWLLAFDRLPPITGGLSAMLLASCMGTLFFGYLTYRARRRAMPVS